MGKGPWKNHIGPAFTPRLTTARTGCGRTVLETRPPPHPGFVIPGANTNIVIIFKHGKIGSHKVFLVPVKELTLTADHSVTVNILA